MCDFPVSKSVKQMSKKDDDSSKTAGIWYKTISKSAKQTSKKDDDSTKTAGICYRTISKSVREMSKKDKQQSKIAGLTKCNTIQNSEKPTKIHRVTPVKHYKRT